MPESALASDFEGPLRKILFFAEINRRRYKQQGTFVATGQFLLGYLAVWTGFSVLATSRSAVC
jgi:predicted metal-binding membrane protein